MRNLVFIVVILCLPLALAEVELQDVTVNLHENGIVEEEILLRITSEYEYDTIEYDTSREPLAVVADVPYDIYDGRISFQQEVFPGEQTFRFTLVFDNLIISEKNTRVYAVSFEPTNTVSATVNLPPGATLADTEPSVSPEPDYIQTDGRTVSLRWENRDRLDAIVIYTGPRFPWTAILAVSVIFLVILTAILFYRKRGKRDTLWQTLTPDERHVAELLTEGPKTQKVLCDEAGFSKSKMSKVIRKLEEKHAVNKEPYMKTNRLKLDREWL